MSGRRRRPQRSLGKGSRAGRAARKRPARMTPLPQLNALSVDLLTLTEGRCALCYSRGPTVQLCPVTSLCRSCYEKPRTLDMLTKAVEGNHMCPVCGTNVLEPDVERNVTTFLAQKAVIEEKRRRAEEAAGAAASPTGPLASARSGGGASASIASIGGSDAPPSSARSPSASSTRSAGSKSSFAEKLAAAEAASARATSPKAKPRWQSSGIKKWKKRIRGMKLASTLMKKLNTGQKIWVEARKPLFAPSINPPLGVTARRMLFKKVNDIIAAAYIAAARNKRRDYVDKLAMSIVAASAPSRKALAEHVAGFVASVRQFAQEWPRIDLFGRVVGVVRPAEYSATTWHMLKDLMLDCLTMRDLRFSFSEGPDRCYISYDTAVTAVRRVIGGKTWAMDYLKETAEEMKVRHAWSKVPRDTVLRKLDDMVEDAADVMLRQRGILLPSGARKIVNADTLMHTVICQWIEEHVRLRQELDEAMERLLATGAKPAAKIVSAAVEAPKEAVQIVRHGEDLSESEMRSLINGVQLYGVDWERVRTECDLEYWSTIDLKRAWEEYLEEQRRQEEAAAAEVTDDDSSWDWAAWEWDHDWEWGSLLVLPDSEAATAAAVTAAAAAAAASAASSPTHAGSAVGAAASLDADGLPLMEEEDPYDRPLHAAPSVRFMTGRASPASTAAAAAAAAGGTPPAGMSSPSSRRTSTASRRMSRSRSRRGSPRRRPSSRVSRRPLSRASSGRPELDVSLPRLPSRESRASRASSPGSWGSSLPTTPIVGRRTSALPTYRSLLQLSDDEADDEPLHRPIATPTAAASAASPMAFAAAGRVSPTAALMRQSSSVPVLGGTTDSSTLDFAHFSMDDSGAVGLARRLQAAEALTQLDLSHNAIGNLGLAAISQALLQCKALLRLDLSYNTIRPAGGSHLVRTLRTADFALVHLNLEGSRLPAKVLKPLLSALIHADTVKTLNLSRNQLSDGKSLQALLRRNASITDLDLSWNNLRGRAGSAVFAGLRRNVVLRRLQLSFNGIGDEAAPMLAKMLMTNHTLQHFDLRFNSLSAAVAPAICKALRSNSALTTMLLTGTELGEAPPLHRVAEAREQPLQLGESRAELIATPFGMPGGI